MSIEYIRARIDELRNEKGLSERKLSLELGLNTGYFYDIRTEKSLPSLSEFLSLCEYLKITPKEFFDNNDKISLVKNQAKAIIEQLDDSDVETLLIVIEKFLKDKQSDE